MQVERGISLLMSSSGRLSNAQERTRKWGIAHRKMG